MVPAVQRSDASRDSAPRPSRWTLTRDDAVAASLGLVAFVIFWASPVQHQTDSRYTLLVTETLLRTGRLDLDQHLASASARPAIYNLERAGGHVYYMPGPGGSVFSIPFVLALRPFGISAVDGAGRYDPAGEYRAQRIIASALMAALAVLFYRTARLLLPAGWSVVVALSAALGTQVWSTASRALWSDTWSIALLGYVVFRVAALQLRERSIRPEWLATLLAAVFVARPTGAAHVLVVTGYVALCQRRLLPRLLAVGAAWMGAFLAYSRLIYGQPLPSYYRFWALGTSAGWQPLLANLFSPSRGLFVCVPLVPLVVYLVVRYRGAVARPAWRLAVTALAGIGGQVLILALWYMWWGGHSYGARLTTGTVPWVALLAAVALRAVLDARQRREVALVTSRLEAAAAAVLVCASVFIQARGALAESTQRWNLRPADVDADPGRVWDWRYPQWLAGIVSMPVPSGFPELSVGTPLALGPTLAEPYLREGWSWPEGELRWSDEAVARLQFALHPPRPLVLRAKLRPGPVWPGAGGQPITVELNGRTVARWHAVEPGAAVFAAGVTDEWKERNELVFRTPDMPSAHSAVGDTRSLRTGFFWIRVDAYPPLRPATPLALGRDDAQAYLGEGWGEPEGEYRWSVAPRAELYLAPEGIRAGILRLRMHPYLGTGGRGGQRVFVSVNGDLAGTLALRDESARVYSVPLPAGLRGTDRIALDLPDVTSAATGKETRRLGVAAHWLKLDPCPPLAAGSPVDLGGSASDLYLGEGWGEREGTTRWTVGLSAEIVFAAEPGAATRLALVMEPFLHERLPAQRVRVQLNGEPLGVLTLSQRGRRPYELSLPSGSLLRANVLRLMLPDAHSPASLGLSGDPRLLGVRVGALELR